MNKVELFVYNIVKNNPQIKQWIVDRYQAALSIIPQNALVTNLPVIERKGYYYGFHDKSPFSSDGSRLLAHRNLIDYRKVSVSDEIEVGYFQGSEWKEYIPLGRTAGWNWQLGSMLQWHGNSNELVVYNTVFNGKHVASVQEINGQFRSQYEWPVVHVSFNQKYACSYNFLRTEKAMPGYGIISNNTNLGDNKDNYFTVFSCENSEIIFKISLAEALAISPQPSMEGAFHFFHHALFNPNSTRVFFLHRWIDKYNRRWSRMFSVGVEGSELYLFPMDEMVSHITWASSSEIYAYLRYPERGDGYFLVEDLKGKAVQYFENVFNSDGHPTMDKKRGIVITDTYPDRYRNQYLALGIIESGERIDLCRTHLPSVFKRDLQVDLHPRLHPFRSLACIDTAHNGIHSLLTIDFSKYLK